MSLRHVALRIDRKLTYGRHGRFPYRTWVQDFDDHWIRFEVHNPTDVVRTEGHGLETDYVRHMLARLTAEDVLWDVGACVGLLSLHAARRCRSVVAFEPDPTFRGKLERNIRLNRARNIRVVPVAVSDRRGQLPLFNDGVSINSPSLVAQRGEDHQVMVETNTIDDLAEHLPSPTVIKVDIEGAEILALRGADRVLRQPERPRLLFVEIHGNMLAAFDSSQDEVTSLLDEVGYSVAYDEERHDQLLRIYEAQ